MKLLRKENIKMFATLTHGIWFFYKDNISVYWNRADSFEVFDGDQKIDGFAISEKPNDKKEAKKYVDDWLINYLKPDILNI